MPRIAAFRQGKLSYQGSEIAQPTVGFPGRRPLSGELGEVRNRPNELLSSCSDSLPIWAKIARSRPELGQFWPNLAPYLGRARQHLADAGRSRANSGPSVARFGGRWSTDAAVGGPPPRAQLDGSDLVTPPLFGVFIRGIFTESCRWSRAPLARPLPRTRAEPRSTHYTQLRGP